MTRKPGSSADVNWSLQDCLSQTHGALHQLTVAPTFRQGSKVQHGLLAFILGYISISHPRDEVCFAKVNHHQMFPYKQPKSQLHRYWWKSQSFYCFCRHKTWLSLFTYEAQGLVSPQAAGKASPRPEHWWMPAVIPVHVVLWVAGNRRVTDMTGTLLHRWPCQDKIFWTENSPETHRNQDCPS